MKESIEKLKEQVKSACLALLKHRIDSFVADEKSAKASAESDTKSSAGDKHETAREMVQQEREMIGRRISEAEKQLGELMKIIETESSNTIQAGSLINSTLGWMYLSISLGSIMIDDLKVNIVSMDSPVGKLLKGKSIGDTIELNGKRVIIELVC
jgi:transcription elongation GreA/GreB family factor